MADVALKNEMIDASIEVDLGPDGAFRNCQKLWAASLHVNLTDSLANEVRVEQREKQCLADERKSASWWRSPAVVHFAELAGMDGAAFQSQLFHKVRTLGALETLKIMAKQQGHAPMGTHC